MECSVTGALVFIKIYKFREGTKNSNYNLQIGVTEACKIIMTKATNNIGKKGMKGPSKDCFIFDSCFSSEKSEESEMYVGVYMIGMDKTNTQGF